MLAAFLKVEDEMQKWLLWGSLLILFLPIIQSDLMYGQINLFVLVLLLFGIDYLEKSPLRSGVSFGVAISIKLMPIILLPVIALRRFKNAVIAFVAALVLSIGIPYLIAGNKIVEYYQYWINNIIANEHGEEGYRSFDLPGVVAQLTGMEHPTIVMRLICGLILLGFPIILLRKGKILPAFFLAFMLLPLTATHSENHHLILLMPAMGFVVAAMLKGASQWTMWCGVLALQLSILWGFNAAIPFDTIGMLVLFGIVFSIALRSNEIQPVNEEVQKL